MTAFHAIYHVLATYVSITTCCTVLVICYWLTQAWYPCVFVVMLHCSAIYYLSTACDTVAIHCCMPYSLLFIVTCHTVFLLVAAWHTISLPVAACCTISYFLLLAVQFSIYCSTTCTLLYAYLTVCCLKLHKFAHFCCTPCNFLFVAACHIICCMFYSLLYVTACLTVSNLSPCASQLAILLHSSGGNWVQ